jgi:Carboxypeptidase regulatory-like domain
LRVFLLGTLILLTVQQSMTGRVEIMVRDANTREGVPGVPVTLTFKFPNQPAGPSTSLLTDPRGLAVFSALGEGMYTIKLGETFKPLPFTDYVLLDGGDQKRLELAVNRIANVSVRVLDQNAQPLKNALVTLPSLTYVNGRRTLKEVSGILHNTDGNGNYQLTGVPSGEYYLRIEHQEPPVSSSREAPPRDAYYPGVLDFGGATRVIVRGDDLLLGEIRLPLQRVFRISGTIVNPIPDAQALSATSRTITSFSIGSPDSVSFAPTLEPAVRYTTTSDPRELLFELDGLTPGAYALYPVFLSREAAETLTNRTVVTLDDRNIEGLRIVLQRRIRMEAKVTLNGDSVSLPQSLGFALVSKQSLPALLTPPQDAGTGGIFVRPDPQTGKFVVLGLVEGTPYSLRPSGLPVDAYIADIRTGGRSILADGFFTAQSSQEGIEVQIGIQGGAIQGIVRDAMNQPAAGAAVVIVPDFAKRKNSFLYKRATANSEGQFSVRGLAPGDYQLFAWPSPPPQGAEEDPIFLGPFEGRGVTVRANAGLTTEASLRVIP